MRSLPRFVLASLLFAATATHAGSLTRSNYGGFEVRNSGNTWTIGDASPRPGDVWGWTKDPTATVPVSPNFGLHDTPNGPVLRSNGQIAIPGSNGRNLPVVVNAQISKLEAAKAIGKFALKVAGPLSVGMGLYELYQALGIGSDPATGLPMTTGGGMITGTYDRWMGNAPYGGYETMEGWGSANKGQLDTECQARGYLWAISWVNVGSGYMRVTCEKEDPNGPAQAMTEQQLVDKIASESGWPSGGSKSLAEAIAAGEVVVYNPPVVSGPATVQGPTQQSTTNKPDGSVDTTTKQTVYNNTYQGATITITNTTTTTTTNSATNTTTTTTEQSEAPEDDQDVAAPTDTELPELPQLYEPKYPDGPGGVWDAALAQIKATPLFQLPAQLAPNLGDSGGCPAWSVPLSVGLVNFGVQNVSLPCSVWAFLRLCIIIGALFLARRLVFGG